MRRLGVRGLNDSMRWGTDGTADEHAREGRGISVRLVLLYYCWGRLQGTRTDADEHAQEGCGISVRLRLLYP